MLNPYLPQSASLRCCQIIIDPDAVTIMIETMRSRRGADCVSGAGVA